MSRSLQVRFSKASRSIIKVFFSICRIEFQYSMKYLSTLIRCASAHARLQLRTTVKVVDCLVGIMLMEETRAATQTTSETMLHFTTDYPYRLHIDMGYDGETESSRFLSFYAHVLSIIQKRDPTFNISIEDDE
eukprot:CRZ04390.1 hypothetical protein [Spongospora subterranea]